jgi:hypothetical protein
MSCSLRDELLANQLRESRSLLNNRAISLERLGRSLSRH